MPGLNKKDIASVSPKVLPGAGSHEAQSHTQERTRNIQNIGLVQILSRLSKYLNTKNIRELQKRSIEAILETMKDGKYGGIIKLPTGAGKTRLFAMLLRAIGENGLILIPRVALYNSTVSELQSVGFDRSDIHLIQEQYGGNIEDRLMSLLIDPDIDWSSGRNQCIMTYQSLTLLIGKNIEMIRFIQSHFGVVIEDEAHRGLGDKTKRVTTELIDQTINQTSDFTDTDELKELDYEKSAHTTVSGIKYNFKFTATPELFRKSVTEDGEYVYYATVEDGVRTGAIILPQYVDMGSAYTKDAELENWKISDIEALAEGDNFIDESGKSIRDKIIDTYVKKRELHDDILPGVAFASTIRHAEQIVEAYKMRGIRAIRVTSDSSDILPEQAIGMLDRGELDVIVTVTKVSEGFDYPPLACAMWFCPSLSPAKVIQGNGRIMRMTESKKTQSIVDSDRKILPSPGAYIIAPSIWYGGSREGFVSGLGGGSQDEDSMNRPDPGKKSTIPRIGNFYELLVEKGEMDIDSLGGELQNLINREYSLRCESEEEKRIDGILYIGVSIAKGAMGVKGQKILNSLKKRKDVIGIPARQANGLNITLVPKSFIESLRIEYICDPGEEKKIGGVVYVGVSRRHKIMGVNSFTILRNLRTSKTMTGIPTKQSNGRDITLVPKSFIEGLIVEYRCQPGEEKEVEGILYVGVSGTIEIMGVKGWTILSNLKKREDIECITAKQANGSNITLVPKSFIESLQVEYLCEPGEEKNIKGIVYIGICNSTKAMGLGGESILKHLRKSPHIQSIGAKQRNGSKITLVPKSFIEGLNVEYRCESGGEIELDGVMYVGVTRTNEVMGIKGQRIMLNLDKPPSIVRFPARQNNGMNITLVPKSFIESFIVDYISCESGAEKEIKGIVYMGVTYLNKVMGIEGQTILRKLREMNNGGGIRAQQSNGLAITLVPKSFIESLKRK